MKKSAAPVSRTTAGPFGRLLRFWRTTFGMSQEELALETNVSPRHVSFLETGRSQPGRGMVINLARVFGLSKQDLNSLLVAGGFAVEAAAVDLESEELGWLRKSLQLTIRAYEPWPASVMDRYGNIHLVNEGWLRLYAHLVSPEALEPPLNAYHLFFSDAGLRPHLVDWEDVACRLLVTLQQELLLANDAAAGDILQALLQYPSLPENWAQRGSEIAHMHSFRVRLRFPDGSVRAFLNIVNTIGATPYVNEPRLLISLFTGEDLDLLPVSDERPMAHPLLIETADQDRDSRLDAQDPGAH